MGFSSGTRSQRTVLVKLGSAWELLVTGPEPLFLDLISGEIIIASFSKHGHHCPSFSHMDQILQSLFGLRNAPCIEIITQHMPLNAPNQWTNTRKDIHYIECIYTCSTFALRTAQILGRDSLNWFLGLVYPTSLQQLLSWKRINHFKTFHGWLENKHFLRHGMNWMGKLDRT